MKIYKFKQRNKNRIAYCFEIITFFDKSLIYTYYIENGRKIDNSFTKWNINDLIQTFKTCDWKEIT